MNGFPHGNTNDVLQLWVHERLDNGDVPAGLGRQIDNLASVTGIAREPLLALLGLMVATIAGPSRWVRTSGQAPLPLSFNLVFVTKAPLPLARAVRHLFEPLSTWIRNTLRAASLDDPHRRDENLLQQRLHVLHNQDLIDRYVPPAAPVAPDRAASAADLRAQTAAFEARLRRDQALKQRPQLLAQLARAEFRARPGIVAEALGPDELLSPGRLSFDAAVTNVSCTGETLRSLARAEPAVLRHLGRLLRSSWFGTAEVGACPLQSGRAGLANLWLVEPTALMAALHHRPTVESELLSTFLFIDADQPDLDHPPDDAAAEMNKDQWLRTINLLLLTRLDAKEIEHSLDEPAGRLFAEFSKQTNALLVTLPSAARQHAVHWPELALKLGLSIHLAGHDPLPPKLSTDQKPVDPVPGSVPVPEQIGAASMRAAVKVMRKLAAGHLAVLQDVSVRKIDGVNAAGNEIERMVTKIKKWGPLTRRSLFRRYSRQASATLEPILSDALKLGRVHKEGKLLAAVAPSSTSTVSENASASACQ